MSISLYELSADYQRTLNNLINSDDEEVESLTSRLDSLQGELEIKSKNVAAFFLNLEAEAELVEEAAKKMKERATALKSKAASLKEYLLFHMERCGITEIKCPEFCIQLAENPWSVVIEDATLLPAEFFVEKISYQVDKNKLKELLKNGECIEGARLQRTKRLIIK